MRWQHSIFIILGDTMIQKKRWTVLLAVLLLLFLSHSAFGDKMYLPFIPLLLKNSHTVIPSAGAGGTISPDTPQSVGYKDTTSFIVTPDAGYSIDEVSGTCGGMLDDDGATITFTTEPITVDCTVEASFVFDRFTVTPSAGAGGIISPDTAQSVVYNGTVSFTVTPDTGYSIASVDGSCGGTLAGYTYTTDPITADCTVEASFVINTYRVTPSAGAGGSISPDEEQTVEYGQTSSFTLTPESGYYIGAIGGSCGGRLDGMTYTTNTITADCTVIVSFTDTSYMVTPSVDGEGGSISPETSQIVGEGGTSAFTLTPDTGYYIGAIGGSCGGSLEDNRYTTSAITADCTVIVSFTDTSYMVRPSVDGEGGSISPDTVQTVGEGGTKRFTLIPETDYYIGAIGGTCGGRLDGMTYTTNTITADCTVIVSFTDTSYMVTPSVDGEGGIISPDTAQIVGEGGTSAFTVTPDTGYSIASVDGSCGGTLAGDTYTTNPITADCSVEASFFINTYTVTPSAGAGGSISPDEEQTVEYGQTSSFTLNSRTGYYIGAIGGSCGGRLDGDTYTTNTITADCTVIAVLLTPAIW